MEQSEETITGERCPVCLEETLTLTEHVLDVPHFGTTLLFSMECADDECGFAMSDVEAAEDKDPVSDELVVDGEEKLRYYVVKSASATITIPGMVEITPGAESSGYITTVEGVLTRFRDVLEQMPSGDSAGKAKSKLDRLERALDGREELTITLEDETGNSAIIRERLALEEELPENGP